LDVKYGSHIPPLKKILYHHFLERDNLGNFCAQNRAHPYIRQTIHSGFNVSFYFFVEGLEYNMGKVLAGVIFWNWHLFSMAA
jgi:hypothetical protein